MLKFKYLWSSIEWGLLYGFITWILGTGVSNRIPGWGAWFIIFNRVFMALVIHFMINSALPKWLRGVLVGLVFSIPLGLVVSGWPFFNALIGNAGAMGTGIISGILMAYSIHPFEPEGSFADKSRTEFAKE